MERSDARMLIERAKELECMYAVDEVLADRQLSLHDAMQRLTEIIPAGFCCAEACRVRIALNDRTYQPPDFGEAQTLYRAPVLVNDREVGSIEVGYLPAQLGELTGELMEHEARMLRSIAGSISRLTLHSQSELATLFDMLQRIDPDMLLRICEKLRLHLKSSAAGKSVDELFKKMGFENMGFGNTGFGNTGFGNTGFGKIGFENTDIEAFPLYGEVNAPLAKQQTLDTLALSQKLIQSATSFLSSAEVYVLFTGWIQDERAFSLVKAIDSRDASISRILDAVMKYTHTVGRDKTRNALTETWLVVELAHRFLTSDEHLISMVQDNLEIQDFVPLMEKIIGSESSRGHVGGKGAGLFIAQQILKRASASDPLLQGIKTPRTWYVAADQLLDFLHYNHLEELNAYKYNSPLHLRMTYGDVVGKIKSAKLPPHTEQLLSLLLDDLRDTPIIVRSSSLLEDSTSATFSGKYKSLFLPNQGPKQQRLAELTDAILEVYSSQYNPDSIQYRKERELVHFSERMGVLIQEVIGKRAGRYFLPAYAGVVFSDNTLRWATRINRADGLVRVVMGLGTRAVDRVNDDYPLLFSPGQPGLRVNQSPASAKHYAQKHIDLINLESHQFETVPLDDFLREAGAQLPGIAKLVSVYAPDILQSKSAFELDFARDDTVVTFAGLLDEGRMPRQIKHMLDALSSKMGTAVDIEFASDGDTLYLLQCRPQGKGPENEPAPIPQNLSPQNVLFTANRFISNGTLDGISHIVYVDPDGYSQLPSRETLLDVGRAIGRLNDLLPKRKHILIGPGRWGSRGDIKLGVRVTYSDICNTLALIEIAKEKHAYVPEISFGTHFFQDLVESDILYIPLYPGQQGVVFKESFFLGAENMLPKLLPEFAALAPVLRVIDVRRSWFDTTLSIYLNADLEECVAFFNGAPPPEKKLRPALIPDESWGTLDSDQHWRWRYYMAQQIAADMDLGAYGVQGIYLFGSTNTGNTGMGSDIDLLIHFDGDAAQRSRLTEWLNGWSHALAKINFLRTGYSATELLDVHIVTDADIENNDPFATKIHSVSDPATPLRLR